MQLLTAKSSSAVKVGKCVMTIKLAWRLMVTWKLNLSCINITLFYFKPIHCQLLSANVCEWSCLHDCPTPLWSGCLYICLTFFCSIHEHIRCSQAHSCLPLGITTDNAWIADLHARLALLVPILHLASFDGLVWNWLPSLFCHNSAHASAVQILPCRKHERSSPNVHLQSQTQITEL